MNFRTALQGGVDELTRHNIGIKLLEGADQVTPGFMLSGSHVVARGGRLTEAERRRRDDERFALGQMKAALDARLAELDLELAVIDKAFESLRQRRIEVADGLEAIDELARMKAAGVKLNEKEHGHLLRAAGITAEDARGGGIDRRRRDLSHEDGALEDDWNRLIKRRDQFVRERDAVVEARAEIENANNNEEALAAAERRAATVLGEQQLTEAAYLTDSREAKLVAAHGIANAQAPDVREASRAYGLSGVQAIASVTATSSEEFDFGDEKQEAAPSASPKRLAP